MTNAVYWNLIDRLQQAIELDAIANSDVLIFYDVLAHMEALVAPTASASSVGYLFMTCFLRECRPLQSEASPGLAALARAAFEWSMAHEEWTTAAWLISIAPFKIPLPSPQHPHPGILHALVCNDSIEWPELYTAALKDETFVIKAMAYDVPDVCMDDEALTLSAEKYAQQIRKACYFGPAHGLHGATTAMRWLALHHEADHIVPSSMPLRHFHPEAQELSRLLQNQWHVDQFWLTQDTMHLDKLLGLSLNDFQSWLWLANAKYYSTSSTMCLMVPTWEKWWQSRRPDLVEHAQFWLGLHMQMQGLNYTTMRKFERLLAVRDALALARRPPGESCVLPEEYLEIPWDPVSPICRPVVH